jgi:hypothetical protein
LAVIRTVWLTVLCLSGAGGVVAINTGTSAPQPIVAASPEPTTSDQIASQDTLTEADRLLTAYISDAVAAEPAIPVTKAPDQTSPQVPVPTARPRILNRHGHDPNAGKTAAASPDRRIKSQQPNSKNIDRGKPTVDLRPCRRPEGFAGLLRALNLTPGCNT